MKTTLRLTICMVCWALLSAVSAQTVLGHYSVANTAGDGIKDGYIYDIAVDSEMDIWVATEYGGLNVFDGTNWTYFDANSGLPSSEVYSVLIDQRDAVWIGTEKGLAVKAGDLWTYFDINNGLGGNYINCSTIDHDGNYWFGTDNGVSKFDGTEWTNFTVADGLSNFWAYDVFADSDNNIWAAFWNGVSMYDGSTWITYDESDGMSHSRSFSIISDDSNRIWIGTRSAISIFDGTDWERELLGHQVNVLKKGSDGKIWAGTRYNGIKYYDGTGWTTYDMGDMAEEVNALLVLESDVIYAGSHESFGISDGSEWDIYVPEKGLISNDILAIATDFYARTWYGTDRGLSIFDGTTWINYDDTNMFHETEVYDLHRDREGNMWLGMGSNAYVWNDDSWTWDTIGFDDGLLDPTVFGVSEDRDGNIWFSTRGGACMNDGSEWHFFTTSEGLLSNDVYDVMEDVDGNMWFATLSGLSKYDGVNWEHFTTANVLPHNRTFDVYQDSRGDIWVGSFHHVSRFDGTDWKTFYLNNGRITNEIAEDSDGTIWIATSGGLRRFDGEDFKLSVLDIPDNGTRSIHIDDFDYIWIGSYVEGTYILDNVVVSVYNSHKGSVKLCPNPASTLVDIEMNEVEAIPDRVVVYDINGRVITNNKIISTTSRISIDVSSLVPGMYVLEALLGADRYVSRLVVQR